MKHVIFFVAIHFFCFQKTLAQQTSEKLLERGFVVESFSEKDLFNWETIGKGKKAINHGQLVLSEVRNSVGYMIVSPTVYNQNVVMSFDVMSLNPATVLVVELSASNKDQGELEFSENYNGNVSYLFKNVAMYMFAFHNAAHNKPGPFIRKYPIPGTEPLVTSNKNILLTGVYQHIEIGREGENIWMRVDGKNIVSVIDQDALKSGKFIFRIRGTAHELASCLIKNMKVYFK